MKCQRDVAMRTARHPAADAAFDVRGVAAAVLEEDDLLVGAEGLAHLLQKLGRECAADQTFAPQFFHIYDLHFRQLHLAVAFGETDVAVLAEPGIVVAVERGSSRAEEHVSFGTSGHEDCDIACVVTWRRVLLLEVHFMFLIDNDESQLIEG